MTDVESVGQLEMRSLAARFRLHAAELGSDPKRHWDDPSVSYITLFAGGAVYTDH